METQSQRPNPPSDPSQAPKRVPGDHARPRRPADVSVRVSVRSPQTEGDELREEGAAPRRPTAAALDGPCQQGRDL